MRLAAVASLLLALVACSSDSASSSGVTGASSSSGASGSSGSSGDGTMSSSSSGSSGTTPKDAGSVPGTLPAGLAAKMLVGVFEDGGKTWMKDSGVGWNARYRYIVKGWANNFGYGQRDGSFAKGYFDECAAQNTVPAIAYYQMNGEPGGGENAFLTKAQNATTMKSYFDDFKLLMQRVKDFGKPVLVLLEADGYAFMQKESNGDANAAAAVASTGLAELAGLPNTVAGWGQAFVQMKKAVGASNAVLGMHVSGWASGKDVAYYSLTDPLEPEVTKVYDFLSKLGLAEYDVLVGDPLDRDSDFYRLVNNDPNRWWDASDDAPVTSRSFNRYAEWLKLWNAKSGKRWVLWQIPLGNANHLNVNNDGQPRQGYQDNRTEYFMGPERTKHLEKFAAAGTIALLFGAGVGGQSSYENDTGTDGQLYLKSHAADFFKSGGFAIAP